MNRYRSARETAGLSMGQASRLLSVPLGVMSVVHLSDVELGRAEPATAMLAAMGEIYGCSVAWLRGETAQLSAENEALLRDVERTGDRATVREFMEMISTRDTAIEPGPHTCLVAGNECTVCGRVFGGEAG